MPKSSFQLESELNYFKPTIKDRTSIRVNAQSWEWMMAVRARTGIPITKLVDRMVAFCDENLEIVPKGAEQPEPPRLRDRPVDELLGEASALLIAAAERLRGEEECPR